jgi:hypothetical protein
MRKNVALSERARDLLLSYFLATALSPSLTSEEKELAQEVIAWFEQYDFSRAKQVMLEGLKAHLTECETESRGEHQ